MAELRQTRRRDRSVLQTLLTQHVGVVRHGVHSGVHRIVRRLDRRCTHRRWSSPETATSSGPHRPDSNRLCGKRHDKSRAVVAILTGPCIIYHCATDNVTYAIRKCFADSLLIFVKYNKHCVLATEHRHTGN